MEIPKATVRDIRLAVKHHPGKGREYYVGHLEMWFSVTSIRTATRRALKEGVIEAYRYNGNKTMLVLPKRRSMWRWRE